MSFIRFVGTAFCSPLRQRQGGFNASYRKRGVRSAVTAVIPGMRTLDEPNANLSLMDVDIPEVLWTDLGRLGLSRGS